MMRDDRDQTTKDYSAAIPSFDAFAEILGPPEEQSKFQDRVRAGKISTFLIQFVAQEALRRHDIDAAVKDRIHVDVADFKRQLAIALELTDDIGRAALHQAIVDALMIGYAAGVPLPRVRAFQDQLQQARKGLSQGPKSQAAQAANRHRELDEAIRSAAEEIHAEPRASIEFARRIEPGVRARLEATKEIPFSRIKNRVSAWSKKSGEDGQR